MICDVCSRECTKTQDQGQRPLEPQPLRRLLQSPPQPQARGTARTRRATRIGPRSRRPSLRVALVRVLRRRRQPARPRLLHARGHAAPLALVRCRNSHNGLLSADATAAKLRERACEGLWTVTARLHNARERRRYGRLGQPPAQPKSRPKSSKAPADQWQGRPKHSSSAASAHRRPHPPALPTGSSTPGPACPTSPDLSATLSGRATRDNYRRRMSDPAKRAEKRAKESARRLTPRPHQPNLILTQAREAAGYTLSALASALGSTVRPSAAGSATSCFPAPSPCACASPSCWAAGPGLAVRRSIQLLGPACCSIAPSQPRPHCPSCMPSSAQRAETQPSPSPGSHARTPI